MTGINFDHSYTEDIGHRFFKTLGRAGFLLSEHQTTHPGKHFCRFIVFNRGDGRFAYLEFVDVGRGGKRVDKPGISLRCDGPLKKYFAAVKRRDGVAAKYKHRNYEWSKDSKSYLPGWNFLTFDRPRFKNIYPWFTEYEPRPGRKRTPIPKHPNTALAIAGVALAVREQDRTRLEKVLGVRLDGDNVSLGGIRLLIEPAKVTRISALIIKCDSLKCFMRAAKIKTADLWHGQPAAAIRNTTSGMWDIVAVEGLGIRG